LNLRKSKKANYREAQTLSLVLLVSASALCAADQDAPSLGLGSLEREYAETCNDLSLLTRIKLIQELEKRRELARQCSPALWKDRAWNQLVDPKYTNQEQSDKEFRSGVDELELGTRVFLNLESNSADNLEVRFFQTSGQRDSEEDQSDLETLKGHKTLTSK
jgi:hypothetical protein